MKWIFRYLKESSKVCLSFEGKPLILIDYIDVDMTRDIDIRKSTSGFVLTFFRGSCIITIQIAKVYYSLYHRGRIYYCYGGLQRNILDEKILIRIGTEI